MLKPDLYVKSILQIDTKMIKQLGVGAIILDVDNTIRRYKEVELLDGVLQWIENIKDSGFKIIIVSNNFKRKVEPVAKTLNLSYVSLGFKPLPFGLNRAFKKLGVDRKEVAVIGDQFFTDIIGAKIKGFRTILTKPIKEEKGFFWKIRRGVERKILNRILK